MKKSLAIISALGLVAAFAVAVPTFAQNSNKGEASVPCGTDGTITASPTALWPPNHKDVPITFTYTDPTNSNVVLEVTANPHNEIVDDEEINGTGNTPAASDSVGGASMDSDGSTDVVGSARAERSGHKNEDEGRVYEFDYVAEADMGLDGCETMPGANGDGIIVFVPHDCRGGICH